MTIKVPSWTIQQKTAIETLDREVLVTASAGTGKTAVLSRRCADILTNTDNLTDVSQILVLTFTDAAAEEMRCRIAENLRVQLSKKSDVYLRRQLLALDAAHISTIHSFCKRIITEHFHALAVDPTFRIIDSDEQALLKFNVLNQIIEEAWNDPALSMGMNKLLYRRNVQSTGAGFLEKIISLSGFLDSIPSRQQWYERAGVFADTAAFAGEHTGGQQKQIITDKLELCKSQLEYSLLLDENFTPGGHWKEQIGGEYLGVVNRCIEDIRQGKLEKCADAIRNFTKSNFNRKPKDMCKDIADLIKKPAAEAMKTFSRLSELAILNPDYEQVVAPAAGLGSKVVVELVKRFDRGYAIGKQKLNCLDFADLQHYALRLLNESGSIAEKLRQKFKYIFIDEYQDINPIQQSIIDKLSREDNVFIVGDIKQSIYAFRQAQPGIFLRRLNAAADSEKKSNLPVRVDLTENFRSRKGVLDFANIIFGRIMNSSLSSVDYDERAYLCPSFDYKPAQGPLVEMYVLSEDVVDDSDEEGDGFAEIISSTQRQAAFIAEKISRMVDTAEFDIYDKKIDSYRPVEYRDIVILMRSPANAANDFIEVLRLAGIAVSSQSTAGYFAATEITDTVSLLKVLDNPQRDIELAAVLRSPFLKISDTQLAMIRTYGQKDEGASKRGFYECVRRYSQDGPDEKLRGRVCEILKTIDDWRLEGRRGSIAELLWKIFRRTGYLSFVSGLPNGKGRRANLLKMHDRAIQFEGFVAGSAVTSLTRFVEFIEKLLEQGQDWAPAEPDSSAQNAVRIMSVHKSKGLEFPVVFLAGLNRRFNTSDISKDCLIDDANAIGLQIIEPRSKAKLSTLAHQVIAEKNINTMLAEEMRILYVAMTRARERLILVGSKKLTDCASLLTGPALLADEPISEWQLRSAKSHFDWLLYGLANQKRIHYLFGINAGRKIADDDCFRVELLGVDKLNEISSAILQKKRDKLASNKTKTAKAANGDTKLLLSKIKESVTWRYRFEEATQRRAKSSVSELAHKDDEFAETDLSDVLGRLPKAVCSVKAGADSKAIGTATHHIIQKLDLSGEINTSSIEATLKKLIADEVVSEEVAGGVNIDSVQRFFRSDLGTEAIKYKDKVLREWPFTFIPQGEASAQENTIVQGIIDMIIPTPGGLVVIDFKTDHIAADLTGQRAKRYAEQLNYYTQAAGAILNEKIRGGYLYFLETGQAVSVK